MANLAVATDSRRNLEARLIEPDNEEPGIATKSADSHAEEHSLLAQSPDLPAELEGKVERLIGLWKADELELMRPKAIDLGNKPKGLDTTQKSMQFILMDIRSYLFERGQLSRSALIGVIAQVAMQLGNTERDAKLIAKKILKRAYDDF